MLPRPRLVCQEPGLRPIGRSPCVPDKSSRGLGSMSRYSAQILICFIAYIFQFSISCRTTDIHSALCHCPLQSKWGCSWDNQISQHALLRCSSMETLSGNYATELVKLIAKMDELCIKGRFQYRSQVNGEFYFIPQSNFTAFQPRIQTDFRNAGIRSSQVVLKIWVGQEFDSCKVPVTLEFEILFQAVRHENVEI